VALLKTKLSKPKPENWINDATRAVRCECRRAEWNWKKDSLPVSFQILKESWRFYQRTVKSAKTKYFSDIIARGSVVVLWLAPSPHSRGFWVQFPAGSFLCGVCMLSPCMCGFSLGTLASHPKTCLLCGWFLWGPVMDWWPCLSPIDSCDRLQSPMILKWIMWV